MSTQPITMIAPTQPPPQTVCGVLQQSGIIPRTSGVLPGERPSILTHLSRAQIIGSSTVTTDMQPGDEVSFLDFRPLFPSMVLPPANSARKQAAYSIQVYMNQCTYWNAEVVLHLWAVKPPTAVGRLRIIYIPPSNVVTPDPAQRNIMEDWDLSASNLFEFKIPSYNLRSYRNCVANNAPINPLAPPSRTPVCDFKVGEVRIYVANSYQPGSIYVNDFSIYMFQSFQKPQFCGVVGPGVPAERTALTQHSNPS